MSHFLLYAFCQTVLMIKLTAVARYSESCENLICVMASLAYLNGSVSSSCRFRASSILTTPFVKPTAVMKINHLLYHYPGLYIQGVYWHIVDWLFYAVVVYSDTMSIQLWYDRHEKNCLFPISHGLFLYALTAHTHMCIHFSSKHIPIKYPLGSISTHCIIAPLSNFLLAITTRFS